MLRRLLRRSCSGTQPAQRWAPCQPLNHPSDSTPLPQGYAKPGVHDHCDSAHQSDVGSSDECAYEASGLLAGSRGGMQPFQIQRALPGGKHSISADAEV